MTDSVFVTTNHLLGRKPSDVGDPAAMKRAGFGSLFCNIGDYPAAEWEGVRQGAAAAGLVCGPWLRTQGANGEFDPNRLDLLIDTADAWGWKPLVVNAEKEIDYTGDDLTGYIADQVGDRDAAVSTEVRPFGAVDWRPLEYLPVLPQNFPAETGIGDTDDAIRANWQAAGMRCVVITYGSYRGMTGAQFARLSPYGVYTADDCGNDFMSWQPLGEHDPCASSQSGGDHMETIGNQHGISAMAEVWRAQWPDKTKPNRKPEDLSTWGAIDKLERTLTILARDHDELAKDA